MRALPKTTMLAMATAAIVSLAACGPSKGAGSPATHKFKGVLQYYPLEKGWQWSFTVHDAIGGGMGLIAVTKVVEFDGKVALLATGKELSELRLETDGIVRVDSGAYLLKWPLSIGERWQGTRGAIVEVTQVDAHVQVEAGAFDGCIETKETFRGDEARIETTTFCPDVGPVKIHTIETNAPPGEIPQEVIVTLRSFGPAVDFGAGK
jgi:hypothetical protein